MLGHQSPCVWLDGLFMRRDSISFFLKIALLPLFLLPIAPAVWLLMVAIGVAPMTWGGFFFNWLIVSIIVEVWFIYRRVRDFFREVWALTVYDSLTKQLAELKAKGLDDLQAGAVLIVGSWRLPTTDETLARAIYLSKGLGSLVIGFLMFSRRIGVEGEIKNAFMTDAFLDLHGCLFYTTGPLSQFAGKHMNRIWDGQNVSSSDATDAAFAAYYATLIVPFAVEAWMILAELKQRGFCPEIDTRDHVTEGIDFTRAFMENGRNIDPAFRAQLSQGITHLSEMRKE
jgi:hypothetical protein